MRRKSNLSPFNRPCMGCNNLIPVVQAALSRCDHAWHYDRSALMPGVSRGQQAGLLRCAGADAGRWFGQLAKGGRMTDHADAFIATIDARVSDMRGTVCPRNHFAVQDRQLS